VRAVTAGLGALEALARPGEGRVLASFPKACYLQLPAGLVALVGPGAQQGPIHLTLDGFLPAVPSGDRVSVSPDGVMVGDGRVDLPGLRQWRGELPPPDRVSEARPLVLDALSGVAARCLVPPARAAVARERVSRDDLEGAAVALAGAGPGLTPAGDDALAGILFACRALGCDADLVAIARSARTTTLSGAFLVWAARGQALASVHALLEAAAAGDARGAASAAASLGSVGHSSGADFAWGLCLGSAGRR